MLELFGQTAPPILGGGAVWGRKKLRVAKILSSFASKLFQIDLSSPNAVQTDPCFGFTSKACPL